LSNRKDQSSFGFAFTLTILNYVILFKSQKKLL